MNTNRMNKEVSAEELQELLRIKEMLDRKKKNNVKASSNYYKKNYVITEDMSDEDRQRVQANIDKRKEKARLNYENNKDYHRQKNKKWRENIKAKMDKLKELQGIEVSYPE